MSLPVIVTAFFDLSKRDPSRPSKDYLKLGEFILNLPNPIVMFTDLENIDSIIQARDEKPTRIIRMKFEDLPTYVYYTKISNVTTRNYTNSKNTVDYIILQWSKLWFIEHTITANYYNSSHYSWIDFGIAHVAIIENIENDKLLKQQFDKIKICQMRYLNLEFVYSDYYLQNFLGAIAGGFISGPNDKLLLMCKAFYTTAEYLLSINYCPLEDAIWGILTVLYPQLFDPYYSDYKHMLNNVMKFRGDEHIIANVIKQATQYNDIRFVERVNTYVKKDSLS